MNVLALSRPPAATPAPALIIDVAGFEWPEGFSYLAIKSQLSMRVSSRFEEPSWQKHEEPKT